MIKFTARVCLLAVASLALGAQSLIRPIWVEVLPQQQGRVYAVGAAPLDRSGGGALKQAAQNARLELATRLRASVKGDTSVRSQLSVQRESGGLASASANQQVQQDSRITTQIAELSGLSIAETWTDSAGGTVYALACLDVEAAMAALGARAEAVRANLGAGAAGPQETRDAARAVLRLRKGRAEAEQLELLAAPLMDAGGDPAFRTQLQRLQADLARRLDDLRSVLTLGPETPLGLAPDLLAALRNAAQQAGFGWVDGKGLFSLRVRCGKPWWTQEESDDFVTFKGRLDLALLDAARQPLGTATVEAVGLGSSEANASAGLNKDVRRKLEASLDRWLADLAL